ncbi:T9SS type A sorting domain-containing protein [Flavobacterium sp.]|uniref:T9SS type A sorting domain-containing protein n=1 Tax=Flavobacterium sp. TaxID=239 RepID=UPI002638B377|nr:T9SS type A sorting domain-containing protein [Flavobacterium sp.]
MKKQLLLLFLLLSNAFMASAGTNPPGGTIFYVSPVCQTSPTQSVITNGLTPGGTFSAFPGGLTIDSINGNIFPSQSDSGNYMVTYTIPSSGVDPAFVTTTNVIIVPTMVPQFGFTTTTICAGSVGPTLPATSFNGITGTWLPPVIDLTVSSAYVFIPNPGQCAEQTTIYVAVVALPTAMISASGDNVIFIGTPNATVTYIYNGESFQTITLDSAGTASISLPPNSGPTTICLVSAASNGILNCTASLVGCATVLANSQFDFSDLTYSPNPVADMLDVASKDMIKDVTVFNIMGQKILQQHFDSLDVRVPLGQLKAGNYFVKLESDNKAQVIKVIKE